MLINLNQKQIEELVKCSQNPAYFLEKFCWLQQNETQEVLPFIPFQYQRESLAQLVAGRNIVVYKSRRVGMSWIVAAYAAWLINFRRSIKILFLSKREKDAAELLSKVKFILNNLAYHDHADQMLATKAAWLRGETGKDNTLEFSIVYRDDQGLETSSSDVISLSTTKEAGRSHGATLIFLDEFAFVKPDDERTWAAIKPTVARGGQWIMASSANGVGGVFHRLCMLGRRHENKRYWYREVHWSETNITADMVAESIEGMDASLADQEWELKFIQPGDSVFDATHLAVCYKPLDEFPDVKDAIARHRAEKGIYYSGVDSAVAKGGKRGSEKDYNSFIALTPDGIQAAAVHNKISLGEWAGMTVDDVHKGKKELKGLVSKLHAKYPGMMYIEENGPGHTVINRHQLPEDGQSDIHMGQTTQKFKVTIIQNLALAIEGHQVIITDEFTYQCLMVYQRGAAIGTFGAPSGYNDDPVIALALAWYALLSYGTMLVNYGNDQAFLDRRRSLQKDTEAVLPDSEAPEFIPAENRRVSDIAQLGLLEMPELNVMFAPSLLPGDDDNKENEYEVHTSRMR